MVVLTCRFGRRNFSLHNLLNTEKKVMQHFDHLIPMILEEYPIVKVTDTNYILEDGQKFIKHKLRKTIGEDNKLFGYDRDWFVDKFESSGEENQKKIRTRLFISLEESVKEIRHNSRHTVDVNKLNECGINDLVFDLDEFTMFRNLTKGRYDGSKVVYDLASNKITDISPEVFLEKMPPFIRKEFSPIDAVFDYDPYDISPVKQINYLRQPISRINTYIAPEWRKLGVEVENKLPPIFGRYLVHLFPDIESRRFVLSWLRNLILKRPETILILNGAKGAGKNILIDFCKQLVGGENFGRAKSSLITKEFNSILEDKRLVVLDELRIDKKAHTFLKDICNAEHNIEKKGKDANNLTPTYFGLIISNNDPSDVFIEYNDRRFSTPILAGENLDRVFSKEEIKELIDLMKSKKAIKQIGEFIINYEHDAYSDPFYVLKNEKFHSLVYTSLYGWQQLILDSLMKDNYAPTQVMFLRDDAKELDIKFPSTRSKIENFLQNYMHRGDYRIGYLENTDGKLMLKKHYDLIDFTTGKTKEDISTDDI
jgi:hypothetical protein